MSFIGNVYITDTDNNRIRKVTVSTGIITTIAGTGTLSFSGDGGEATSATLSLPSGVTVDTLGKPAVFSVVILFIYDALSN
jgi:ribosomal protein S11